MIDFHCNQVFRRILAANMAGHRRREMEVAQLHHAAVALCVVEYLDAGDLLGLAAVPADTAALILTRRSMGMKHHPGQWALPGGRLEQGEDAEGAALRELSEEVGVTLGRNQVLGCLDDFVTRSGFIITPVVVWGGVGVDLRKNEREVSSIHRIPCTELLRPDAPLLETSGSSDRPVLFMPVGNTCIAAPTAAMLLQFREVALFGREARVSHYEQPFFAWS
jgi:8-oxo-dGTP pyrophosphatase MutT (NUDIX family)